MRWPKHAHLLEESCGEVSAFNGDVTEQSLLIGFLQNVLFHSALADQPVDVHVTRLTDAVTPVLCLRVHRRVPVAVVKDDGVGTGQVHTESTRARRQDEDEDLRVSIEALHQQLQELTR